MVDRDEIARLTREYGGDFGVKHSERLLHWVEVLGEGLDYDAEVVWLSAYLHDWGGYPKWGAAAGMEHSVRSREVAAAFLAERGCPEATAARVLECIQYHHGGPAGRCIESILLTDADALDLLGVVGVLRIFSMVPRDIPAAVAAVGRWKAASLAAIQLDRTRQLAAPRLAEVDALLKTFEEETFGIY